MRAGDELGSTQARWMTVAASITTLEVQAQTWYDSTVDMSITKLSMEWKKKNRTYQILQAAERGGYGVIAAIA